MAESKGRKMRRRTTRTRTMGVGDFDGLLMRGGATAVPSLDPHVYRTLWRARNAPPRPL